MSENPKDARQGQRGAEGAAPRSTDTPQGDGYQVGYGKPPKHTRFAKGQSGNPRGRPRKVKPRPLKLSDAPSDLFLEEEAYRSVTLRENGQPIELPALQAVRRAAAAKAIQGNRLAMKFFMECVAEAEEQHYQRKIRNYRWLEGLKRDGEQALADAKRRGLSPPELLPHPEDIVLDPATAEARIVGPATAEEAKLYEDQAQLRDLGLLFSAQVSDRRGKKARRGDDSICVFGVFAHLLDHYLPLRYRWQDGDAFRLMVAYQGLTRREREQRIEAEYARLESTRPRQSRVTPEMEEGIDRIVRKFLAKPRNDPAARHEMQGDG